MLLLELCFLKLKAILITGCSVQTRNRPYLQVPKLFPSIVIQNIAIEDQNLKFLSVPLTKVKQNNLLRLGTSSAGLFNSLILKFGTARENALIMENLRTVGTRGEPISIKEQSH